MDMTAAIAPRSDQLNADDLISGPIIVTITEVTEGNSEQPVNIKLVEFPGRPYKPSKSMSRMLVAAWGKDSTVYAGRRVMLFRNPETRFGKEVLGGIEISHLSHIDEPVTIPLTVTRGRRKNFTVQPLKEAPAAPKRDFLAEAEQAGGDTDLLRALWKAAQAAGEPQAHLDAIFAMATPANDTAA